MSEQASISAGTSFATASLKTSSKVVCGGGWRRLQAFSNNANVKSATVKSRILSLNIPAGFNRILIGMLTSLRTLIQFLYFCLFTASACYR